MTDYDDFDALPPAGSNSLGALGELVEKQKRLEVELADLEDKVAKKKEELRDVSEREIPELMDQFNISQFQTGDGMVVKVDEKIRASIPKARREQAYSWLENNGHGNLLKRQLICEFGREQEKQAQELEREIREREGQFNVKTEKQVHSQTLSSWVREKLQNGEEVPQDLLGVHRQRYAKVES